MDFELKTLTRERLCLEKCDALVVLVAQESLADHESKDVITKLIGLSIKSGDMDTKAGKLLSCYRVAGVATNRLVLVGVGDGSQKSVRIAVMAAVNFVKSSPAKRVVVSFCALKNLADQLVCAAVVGAGDAAYNYATTKSKSVSANEIEQIVLAVPNAEKVGAAFKKAQALALGIGLTKEWANRPANHATPVLLAGAAKALAKLANIKTEVLGLKEVTKLGMGAFMAVAQGSAEPLQLIVLYYNGGNKGAPPVVLIGKGITFDTGGISIKPAAEMDEMKFDMCGAASVLGTFRALADLKPAINVIGLIPACENMPDGRAIKPGDVVTSMSGQTIEILNTDAEGRLVLCDTLTYAERFKPRAVIDIATLTGACVVALGAVRSGLFSSDEPLAKALQDAGESSLDLCWRMPLDEEYAEGLKTNFADVANVAGRAGGAVTAAKFLQRFAGKFAWAHLDIAGTAWKSGTAKGATGRPVALLVDYLLGQADEVAIAVAAKTPVVAAKKRTRSPTSLDNT